MFISVLKGRIENIAGCYDLEILNSIQLYTFNREVITQIVDHLLTLYVGLDILRRNHIPSFWKVFFKTILLFLSSNILNDPLYNFIRERIFLYYRIIPFI